MNHIFYSPDCPHLVVGVGGGLAGLNDLTGYAGGNFMFLVGPPKPGRPQERGQTKTNWSSKNGGFADGLVTLPRETKYS